MQVPSRRPKILCFVAHYLPGYRSGGPVRTIANFVEHLGDEFDIRIVCRDRDALDRSPYPDVAVDAWSTVGKAQVFYASSRTMTLTGVARLLRDTPHEVLYLNSFFAFAFTGLPLLARRLGMAPLTPAVIAPRGEFSAGAISLKAAKKRVYLATSKAVGLYDGLYWQASSDLEVADIRREFGLKARIIRVASNLPPKIAEVTESANARGGRAPGPVRVIFLSRISPKKNLDFLLRVLKSVTEPVDLAIYGPLCEPDYWQSCMNLIEKLPTHVAVNYVGEVKPADVIATFAQSDLFVLPTRGENYGHVILESLMAGTPVLLSNQTPWGDSGDGALNVLALKDELHWQQAIDQFAKLSSSALAERRNAALAYAKNYLSCDQVIQQNRALFLAAAR